MSTDDQQQPAGRNAEFGQGVAPDGSATVSNLNEPVGPYSAHSSLPPQTACSAQPFNRLAAGVDSMSANIKSTVGLSNGEAPGSYTRFSQGGPFVQNSNGMSQSTHDQSLLSLKPVDTG